MTADVERIVTRDDAKGTLHLPHLWCNTHQCWEPMLTQPEACRQRDPRVAGVGLGEGAERARAEGWGGTY